MSARKGSGALPDVGRTAFVVAAARAIATDRPDGLVEDRFAGRFVRAAPLPKPLPTTVAEVGAEDGFWLRLADYQGVRSRAFDDGLLGAARAGVGQVVLLAAGLDARAYRLPWPPDTTVFELDHPGVLAFKQRVLDGGVAVPIARRRSVAIDLADDWEPALTAAGFDPDRRTAWLAEGLLPYLSPEVEERMFGTVDRLSAPGSHAAVEAAPAEVIAAVRARSLGPALRGHLDTDVRELWNTEPRPAAADRLRGLGWEVEVESGVEAAVRYHRPLDPGAADSMGASLLLTARLI